MQVSGSAIDRVFNPPIAPPRRFRGAIDAALTLALGSVCAFALTLGPAPLNTVAVSSAAAASFTGQFGPSSDAPLLPAEIDSQERGRDRAEDAKPTPSATRDSGTRPPKGSSTGEPHSSTPKPQDAKGPSKSQKPSKPPGHGKPPHAHRPPKAQPEQKAKPAKPAKSKSSPQTVSPSAALSLVQDYRVASGLDAFVPANECTQATVHSSVTVTPPASLPPGQAKKSLAPDPAFATVSGAPGAPTVTVHACG
jgi:hypothetical protein